MIPRPKRLTTTDRIRPRLDGLMPRLLASAFVFLPSVGWSQDLVSPEGDLPQVPESLGEAHSVRPGDTLWDLCARYLNSPWYWPKIWSYNPQLTNPHWIYPGNELRFYPGDEELPTEIDVGRAIQVDDDDLTIPGALSDDDLVQTVGTIKIGGSPDDSVWASFIAYISKEDRNRAGQIVNSTSEAIMLSDYDRVYIEGREPLNPGDRMAIYRQVREISHPVTGENYGYAVQVVGGLEVLEVGDKVAKGQIAQAYRPIGRGDFVAPWPENFSTRVEPVPNESSAKGYIMETAGDILGPVGEHNMVYIDRGRKHGVQNGNTFDVYHRGDRLTNETGDLPPEVVGKVMVLDAREEASTALVISSLYELAVGDPIEMIPNDGP